MTERIMLPVENYYRGMLANLEPYKIRFCSDPKRVKNDTKFGVPVALDATDKKLVVQPTATGAKIVGILVSNFQKAVKTIDGEVGLQALEDASVMEEGEIVMYAENAVKAYDPVFFRHTADATKKGIGDVTNAAGTGLDQLNGAMFTQTTNGAGFVKVVYRMVYPAAAPTP